MATKRALERRLAVVAGFDDPSARLEQYRTPPDLAAHVVHLADLQEDLSGVVVDLGAGTGMLALGAALRSPERVIGLELDGAALATARDNERRVGARTAVDWVRADVRRAPVDARPDATVLTNPPFGAQDGREGADKAFLRTAAALAGVSYSVHNAGSRAFVESFADDNGGEVTHAYEASLSLDRQFDHHTSDSEDLPVEVYRIDWR